MIKNSYSNELLLKYLIFISFFIHLTAINFYPTNFEGGYGQYSDLFKVENKILYLKLYYASQFNTYIFSALGSIINLIIPFIDGFQAIKIISASSYFFLGYGLFNILKFYEYRYNFILFILVIFLNSIIWTYGYRAFNDLFAFSLAIFAFSRILKHYNKKKKFLDSLILGFSIALKSYNLIFLIPLLILFKSYVKTKKDIYKMISIFIIILTPIIILNIFTYNFLGFILAPTNEDLQIAVIGNDHSRNLYWVLNNFIFYLGYLTLTTLPFIIIYFLSIIKKEIKKTIIFLSFFLILSLNLQNFFFISSELDLGPIQEFISKEVYKTIIIFLFFFFCYFLYTFLNSKDLSKKQYDICKTILFTTLLYLLTLSFIKAAQRYLILPIPFVYLIIFSYRQPRYIISGTLILYIFINSILFTNYYIVGKSSQMIMNFLRSNQLLEKTLPNVITPHVYHLYNKSNTSNNKNISIKSSDYIVTHYKKKSIFSSKINFFGYEIKKFSVIKLKK